MGLPGAIQVRQNPLGGDGAIAFVDEREEQFGRSLGRRSQVDPAFGAEAVVSRFGTREGKGFRAGLWQFHRETDLAHVRRMNTNVLPFTLKALSPQGNSSVVSGYAKA